jgi:hypothetical protein
MMILQDAISVQVGETNAEVTNFPGVVPLANLAADLGLLGDLDRLLPQKERDRGFGNSASVFDLMTIPLAGGQCIDDLAQLRMDKGLTRLLGRQVMAPSTAHDFLHRIRYGGLKGLEQARSNMLAKVAERTNTTVATLDCDASLFTSGGRNAKMSYKGEKGYMPMLAFWAEMGMVVHDDFRNGNTSPGGDALDFLKQTVAQLPAAVTEINVRSDSAWYQAQVMDYCDEQGFQFCISARRDEAVMALFPGVHDAKWQRINVPKDPDDKEDYIREWACESVHTLNDSGRAYRIILLRKERLQGDLFEGDYIYGAIITNMDLPLEEQIAWHRGRCNCENQIKELKWDFELRTLPSGDFFHNAVYLRILTLSFNLFAALKRLKLPEHCKSLRLKALRFRLLALPALITRHARRICLRLPRGHPNNGLFAALAT